jgi:hypothetical protein
MVKIVNYKNYGRCIELSNGAAKLLIMADVGPRVISFSLEGGENMMFEDVGRKISKGPADCAGFARLGGGSWYIYGGHRLWTSPEGMPRSYYPDNEPVQWTEIENGARVMAPPQKWNQYQTSMEITLAPGSTDVTVKHFVENQSAWPVELAPWALTVLSPGGLEIVPQPVLDTGLLANRLFVFWPYAKMNDSRALWTEKYLFLKQNPKAADAWKVGIRSERHFAMYFNHGDMFLKRFEAVEGGNYPDYGVNFETYTNESILEMESLGVLKSVAPGETAAHTEYWSLRREARPEETDAAADALTKKYGLA